MPYQLRSMATADQIKDIYVYMDKKFSELEVKISGNFIDEINDKISSEFATLMRKQNEKIEKLESTVAILQQHVITLKEQTNNLSDKCNNIEESCEELEQYGRRVCLRIDGIPTEKGEKPNDVLEKVKVAWVDAGLDIPESVIDRAHRIGPTYQDRVTQVQMKSVIVRLTTFRHRTMIYQARKTIKTKSNMKVKLDLTKYRYKLWQDGIEFVKSKSESVKFVYVDVD